MRQYLLDSTADLARHAGRQVEVAGMLEPMTTNPADARTPAAVQTTGNPILQVRTVKPLGTPCRR